MVFLDFAMPKLPVRRYTKILLYCFGSLLYSHSVITVISKEQSNFLKFHQPSRCADFQVHLQEHVAGKSCLFSLLLQKILKVHLDESDDIFVMILGKRQ